jgi:tetratricopeptide (TPR) repeat protein
MELGRVLDEKFAFDSALLCFDASLRLRPGDSDASLYRFATLRSQRRYSEAEREMQRAIDAHPHNRGLKSELGWVHHDEHRFADSRLVFEQLLGTAVNDGERAVAHHGLGWIAFAGDDFLTAEDLFRRAVLERPDEPQYKLGLAWALARQPCAEAWRKAEDYALELASRQDSADAHVCLGVVASRRNEPASAEYHLRKALEIDPYRGSRTDLGALYFQLGRYDDAEVELRSAIGQDRYQVQAHIELGAVFLRLGGNKAQLAVHQFREALAIDPTSTLAAIGLAQALSTQSDDSEAESALLRTLQRSDLRDQWRLHLEFARLLILRGDKQQNPELFAEAYSHAQKAIAQAPQDEADPFFVAGVAYYRMGSVSADIRGRLGYRRIAMRHLRDCIKRDPAQADAQRNLLLLEREWQAAAPAIRGGYAVAVISLSLLVTLWVMFFVSNKVSPAILMTTAPILVGLFTIGVLLPGLIKLKLPGFEADLQAGVSSVAPGPTGEVTFGPGRLAVAAGPSGQLPRRESWD